MKEESKVWLTQYVTDVTASPVGAKIVGLGFAASNVALWAFDNINFIAAVSGLVITWLMFRGQEKKRKLEMEILEQEKEKNRRELESDND